MLLFGSLLVLFALEGAHSSYVGMSCSTTADCRASAIMLHSSCVGGKCECDPGFCAFEGQGFCSPIGIGTNCANDAYCNDGVTGSVCDGVYNLCTCPAGFGIVYTGVPKPFCAARSSDPLCAVCTNSGGTCYDSDDGPGVTLTCGCPCQYASSDPDNSLTTGCDQKYAWTKQQCNVDGSVICIDPNAECVHDGALTIEFTCTCKVGYVAVLKPEDPRYAICARRITETVDPDCATCIQNEGQCYDLDDDEVMDGCECPFGRTSPSTDPQDACQTNHFTVNCTSEDMTVCVENVQYLAQWKKMYAEHHEDLLQCHLQEVEENKYCLNLKYGEEKCGLISSENKFARTFAVWLNFQQSKSTTSCYDVCLYGYCTYHKIAKTHTGIIDIKTKKITTSKGLIIKPEVEISIENKFKENLELIGARLGDLVRLIIEIIDDKDIYKTLRAEVCIASNMLSLDHPEAQTAVFILDGCPYEDGLLTHPMPVFVRDPLNPLKIVTNFFPLPKLNCEVIFFQCCVRTCVNEVNCEPKKCDTNSRRKRDLTTALTADGRRVKRSASDILKSYKDSPDLVTLTAATAVKNEGSSDKGHIVIQSGSSSAMDERRLEKLEDRLMQTILQADIKMAEKKLEKAQQPSQEAVRDDSMVLTVGLVSGGLVTVLLGLIIFGLCYVMPRRAVLQAKAGDDLA